MCDLHETSLHLLAHYNALCALQGQLESYRASIPHTLDEEDSPDAHPA